MIDDRLANYFLKLLKDSLEISKENSRYEIADDGNFLLVSVNFGPKVENVVIQGALARAQELANRIIPSRHGDYTWMVNAIQGGNVVESVFGGDAESPSSGML